MATKTFATYLSEIPAVTSLGAGDRIPLLEGSDVKYVDGADVGGGGGITALTGDVTASGTGSVAATIANGAVTDVKVAAGIDAVKIADGTVTNAEFQYLGGVTSDIQTQLNAKQASDATLTAFAALTIASNSITVGTGADAFSQVSFGANTFPARASTGAFEQKTITDFALTLLDDADAATARTTLGISASGDIVNGGNTTGADVVIGTNDAFALNLETSGVTRMAITGGASTGGQVTITNVTANTNTVSDGLTIQTNSSGTAAANFGGGILFQGESSTTDNQDMVRLSAIWTTATHASRASALVYSDVTGGGSLTERFRFTPSSITTSTNFTIGNSLSTLTLSSTANNAAAISLTANNSNSSSVAGINIGGGSTSVPTSGTRNYVNHNAGFAPTSGTAEHTSFAFSGIFNQTGGANGITRGIYLNQTLTAVADFRAIEIAANSSSAKGIYQTGGSTTNNFVGATHFGSTSAPNGAAAVEITSTTKGLLLPRMDSTARDAIGTPVAGLLIYNTTTNKLNVYTTAWEAVTSL